MSRLAAVLAGLRKDGRRALIPYVTAGDPDAGLTVPLMHAMVTSGADVIELGVAFSDPMADGPVIQAACERALAAGSTLARVLDMVREFRTSNQQTPVVLMGYLNPIEAMGYEVFADKAAQAGVDGVLMVDLSVEEAREPVALLKERGVDTIFLAAPTSTHDRLEQIAQLATGYLYYVSLKGVTGSASLNVAEVAERVEYLRSLFSIPVAVGFGIRDAESAAAIASVSDAVVVGSALVGQIARLAPDHDAIIEAISSILAGMRASMDAVCLDQETG